MIILYNIFYFLFCLLYLPYLLIKQKWHKDFPTRFGFLDKKALGLNDKKKIWVHAVSVGEVQVAQNLIKALRVYRKQYQIIISTVTKTGYGLAASFVEEDEVVIFAPLDFSFIARKAVDILNPAIYINAETEIWPNLLTALSNKGVAIVQVNGRISDKAFGGYQKLKRFIAPVLQRYRIFCMQSSRDKERICSLGARERDVHVVGNMKFDDIPVFEEDLSLRVDPSQELWIAGSTHPGEEEILLDTFKKIQDRFPSLRIILAPRHPERADEIAALITEKGFKPLKFSQTYDLILNSNEIMVVDTIGDLRKLYRLARIVFVGKSLTVKGGHNIIEPAFFEKPVIVGPFMQNFRDVTQLFLDNEAIVQIKDEEELFDKVCMFLNDEAQCEELGLKARGVIEEQRGATEKTLDIICGIVEKLR